MRFFVGENMKNVIIKIGRNIATSKRNKLDEFRFEQLAKQMKRLQAEGIGVLFVVSAAVCCGERTLNLKGEYSLSKQLVGGVGQASVIAELYSIFKKHNLTIGQLLLTMQDLEDKRKRETIRTAIRQALKEQIILIVNENDIVELHSFGGNDYLATELAKLIGFDHLLFLSDTEGVLDSEMKIIKTYTKDKELGQIGQKHHRGQVGGIQGKLKAAVQAAEFGITTWITHGKTKDVLVRMFIQNEHIGTKLMGGAV